MFKTFLDGKDSNKNRPVFLLQKLFFDEVEKIKRENKEIKGLVSCHAHLDRAFTVTEENWAQSRALMEEKWKLVDDIRKKNASDPESMKDRIRGVLEMMIEQGVSVFSTNVDADLNTKLEVVKAMNELKEEYKNKISLKLTAHPTQGFLNDDATGNHSEKIKIFEEACSMCDNVGGLPSADRKLVGGNGDLKHMDIIFGIAKNLGKDVDVHIDQENNPYEKDTDKLILKVREYNWEGKVNFVHCISISAQEKSERTRIISNLKDIGANVIVCPTCAIGMKQHDDKLAPLHNSIAPVPEMIEGGVNVALGLDNISDIYEPESSGLIWDEIRMIASACRYYEPEQLAKIATINGYKTLKKIT